MISGLVCILFLSLKLAFNLDGRNQLEHGVKQEHIFCDKLSGAKTDRTGFLLYQESLRLGDTLLVWNLDRLGRSMSHLVTMIEELKEREIGFRSISVGIIDTTTPS